MTILSPSRGERAFRLVTIGVNAAPVPWLSMVLTIVKEIYDISVMVKRFKPQVRALAQEAQEIAKSIDEHEKATGGKSQLKEYIDDIESIVRGIKRDVMCWAKFNIWRILLRCEEISERIEWYTKALQDTMSRFQFNGVLLHDATLMRHEEQIAELQRQQAVEQQRVQQEIEAERDQWLQAEDAFTQSLKEAVKSARMLGIDKIEGAEDEIFKIRMDETHFPSEQMDGEVVKDSLQPTVTDGETYNIWKAKWFGRWWVAAKGLRHHPTALSERHQKRFIRYMNTWRSLKHPNICPVQGIVTFEPTSSPCLISPWMKYGNVTMYLKQFPNADKLKLLYEIATGLKYLHEDGILHGNLNPSHVLVNLNHVARLTGFSLSKAIQGESAYVTRTNDVTKSFRWWSPETLDRGKMSEQSDVWSFGMTAVEIISGKMPYEEHRSPMTLSRIIREDKIRPDPEKYGLNEVSERLRTLILDCWKDYGERPSLDRILGVLKDERVKLGWNPAAPPPEPLVDRELPESF